MYNIPTLSWIILIVAVGICRWYYSDEPITDENPRRRVHLNGTLHIGDVMESDLGRYRCSATDVVETIQSNDVTLMLACMYRIIIIPFNNPL